EEQNSGLQSEDAPEGTNELEILGPRDLDRRRMTMGESGGIEVRSRRTNNVLVYEMKIPLSDNGAHPFAIGTTPGAVIGVGVEAGRNPGRMGPREESGDEGDRLGGGYGGGGGRGGRGGDRGGAGRSGEQREGFKLWAKVRLAAQESSTR